jgi:hypothetical protein
VEKKQPSQQTAGKHRQHNGNKPKTEARTRTKSKRLRKTAVENDCGGKKPRAKMQQDRGDMKKTASKQHVKKKMPKIMPKISGKIGHSDTIDNNHQKQSQDPWKNSAPGLGRQGCTSPT